MRPSSRGGAQVLPDPQHGVVLASDTLRSQVSPTGDREDSPGLDRSLGPGRYRNKGSRPTASSQPPFRSNPGQKLPNTDRWKFSST